jgi:hypothetical protein
MVAVSATSVAGILQLYAVTTGELIFWNTFDGKAWGVWTDVSGSPPFQTQVAVSATGENVFATGLSNELYLNPSPHRAFGAPCLEDVKPMRPRLR